MSSTPGFVAEFDSATALVRALAAALRGEPFRNLGHSPPVGRLARSSALLPGTLATAAFARAGAHEAIPVEELCDVSAEDFAAWVAGCYPARPAPAVAVGSSNGALMHLFAALGVPWLPQTFLVPVARRADPHEPAAQLRFGSEQVQALARRQPDLQVHHMHDPNQDALMVERLAYFRMKQRRLTASYRRFIEQTVPPGGVILVADCRQQWPVTRLAGNHVFQPGAVGGLGPQDYLTGSPSVRQFLAEQGTSHSHWEFPEPDDKAPEAEWGYEPTLTEDIREFAQERGYAVYVIGFDEPEAPSPFVADVYRRWYHDAGVTSTEILAETFIAVEPHWVLQRRAVPLWLTFPVEASSGVLDRFLRERELSQDVLVTLFPNGVRSAGQVPAEHWTTIAAQHGMRGQLVGVDAGAWPADFANLGRYAEELYSKWPPSTMPMPPGLPDVLMTLGRDGSRYSMDLERVA